MIDLRVKIARAMAVRHGAGWECLSDEPFSHPDKPTWNKQYWFMLADAVQAIPEIRDALRLYEKWLDTPSGPPLTTPEEVDAWFASLSPPSPQS